MCFFIYSPQGEIEIDVTEAIYFHPRIFTEFGGKEYKGRTTITIELFVTVKSGTVESLRIIYPNITKYFIDLSKIEEAWSEFKERWDRKTKEVPYSLTPSFSSDTYQEVLKLIPMEIKNITFEEPLKPGTKVPIMLGVQSPNAIDNSVTLDSAFISFDLSGSDNVSVSFESGLEGASQIFQTELKRSITSDEKAANSAALETVKILDSFLLKELQNCKSIVSSWRLVLIFDPRLTNVYVDSDGIKDISALGAPEYTFWPFDLPLYVKLNPLANKVPTTKSFVYSGGVKAKFELHGSAYAPKPTQHILGYIAIVLAAYAVTTS